MLLFVVPWHYEIDTKLGSICIVQVFTFFGSILLRFAPCDCSDQYRLRCSGLCSNQYSYCQAATSRSTLYILVVGTRQVHSFLTCTNGMEAAIHAMHDVFQDEELGGILLADAANAFARLSHAVCLRNVRYLCPVLAPTAVNTYRNPARLFVGGECILSSEGTSQGDPIAMPMYATGVVTLLQSVATEGAIQAWFADDSGAGGKVLKLHQWWDSLNAQGPTLGYFLNASKSVLFVKPQHHDMAAKAFANTGADIRVGGCRHLGVALGSAEFVTYYQQQKAAEWVREVGRLTEIAVTQPQAAYSA